VPVLMFHGLEDQALLPGALRSHPVSTTGAQLATSDYRMVFDAVFELALSAPLEEYARTAKYQVPADRSGTT